MYDSTKLNLKNMEELNSDVEALIPSHVKSIEGTKKTASLTIKIKFKQYQDSPSHIEVDHSVVPTYPSKKKGFIANRDLVGNLRADPEDLGMSSIPRTGQKNLIMEGRNND